MLGSELKNKIRDYAKNYGGITLYHEEHDESPLMMELSTFHIDGERKSYYSNGYATWCGEYDFQILSPSYFSSFDKCLEELIAEFGIEDDKVYEVDFKIYGGEPVIKEA